VSSTNGAVDAKLGAAMATYVLMCRVARERLGIDPDEMESGHLPALSRPRELAERLEAYRTGL